MFCVLSVISMFTAKQKMFCALSVFSLFTAK